MNQLRIKDRFFQKALAKKARCESIEQYLEMARVFESISWYKDADEQAEDCKFLAEEKRREQIYQKALNEKARCYSEEDYLQAALTFESIKGYKDADAQVKECKDLAERQRINDQKTSKAVLIILLIIILVTLSFFFIGAIIGFP